jgi:CO/xanthine dehydrogenase Mo-binding subunit
VRYVGDGVALVAAESEKAALKGVKAVKVEYELLEAVFDPEVALEPGAPLIHGDTNLAVHSKVCKGDVEIGFKEADLILEREYNTHRVDHAPIEPEVAIAVPTFEGVTIYCPTNSPFQVRQIVADTMGMPQSQVRLIQPAVGGSFGSKCYDAGVLASRAAIAAQLTGRPCKIVYTREESIVESTKRHPYKMKYKVGVKKSGELTAMEIKIIGDSGAYKSKTPFVISRSSIEATGPYVVPNVHTEAVCAYTNNVTSCAMRGFGSPQVAYASELLMDELAERLSIDPLEFRRINGLKENSLSATGQVMQNVSLDECIDRLEEKTEWFKRKAELKQQSKTENIVKGLGMACLYRGESFGSAGQGSDYADNSGMGMRAGYYFYVEHIIKF